MTLLNDLPADQHINTTDKHFYGSQISNAGITRKKLMQSNVNYDKAS